jgi:hypothetical protein
MAFPELLPSQFENAILEEAVHSPSVAMMRLSLEVDKQLRLILASTGQLQKYTGQSPTEALDLLAQAMDESSVFPQSLRGTLESFWKLRNEVVHGGRVRQQLAIRAVDYGLRILKMLHAIPRRSYIVVYSTPLFSDAEGKHPRPDVHGVMLQSVGPRGGIENLRVHPTRKNFLPGQSVSWEWDLNGPGWDESWYRDPTMGEIKHAWGGSLEFIGRPLEEI